MVFYYKYISICWCSPLRFASSDSNSVNLVCECAVRVSVTEPHMGKYTNSFTIIVVIHVRFYSLAGQYTFVVFFRPMPIRAAVSTRT